MEFEGNTYQAREKIMKKVVMPNQRFMSHMHCPEMKGR